MSHAANTSGVDRYIGTLIGGLRNFLEIKTHWIHLRNDNTLLFPKEETTRHYIKCTIPLPQQYHTIISERFWLRKYNEQVYRLTKHLFDRKKNCIIHLHTLNLIDLAVYIREQTGCKIITHLHCIPWKDLYNSDKERFNKLYKHTYLNNGQKSSPNPETYVTNNCELQSYTAPDALLCVTDSAVDFLKNCIRHHTKNIQVIPNGIDDFNHSKRKQKTKSDIFYCLYVGVVNESKGIEYVLNALKIVQQQKYKVMLTIAGTCSSVFQKEVRSDYPDLNIDVRGRISFDELKELYVKVILE